MKGLSTLRSTALTAAIGLVCLGAATATAATTPLDPAVDLTGMIENNSFESAFAGWEQSGMQSQNNQTFPLKEGDRYVERWVSGGQGAGNCIVSQSVRNLLPGKYRLTASAQNLQEGVEDKQTGVWIFAGENRTPVNVVADYSVDFELAAPGAVTLGYVAEDATGNYLAVDNFRLLYTDIDAEGVEAHIKSVCDDTEAAYKDCKAGAAEVKALADAIAAARALTTSTDVNAVIKALTDISKASEALDRSIAAYKTLGETVTAVAEDYEKISSLPGADAVKEQLDKARKMYDDATASVDDVEAMTLGLSNAILAFRIEASTGEAPEVETHPFVARGATFALGRSTISGVKTTDLLEHGFCWSKSHDPKVTDNRSTKRFLHNGNIYHMKGLEPGTVYYVRAYAITKDYAVGYGDEVRVITIPKGTITWSYTANDATEDQTRRIKAAVEEAVEYWNNSTSISGFHVSCSYNSGVNTADCSYGGWVRVGPRENYQRTGTLMHEMNHGVGVGQHAVWYGPKSNLRETGTSGLWLGRRANELVQFFKNDPTEMLHGDGQHMWPYGINGAHEDDGTELLYLANGMVTQAVGEDGLPPVAGRIHTPSFAFDAQEGVKYYLKVEDPKRNKYKFFLYEGEDNTLRWDEMTSSKALADDHAAWYFSFDPATQYYTMTNAATGNRITWADNKFAITDDKSADAKTALQITSSINRVPIDDTNDYTYWIIAASENSSPRSLAAMTTASVKSEVFSINNNTGSQRWHIFTAENMNAFDNAAASITDVAVDENEASIFPADVYDVTGRLVRANAENLDGLRPGIYIAGGRKMYVR